MPRPPCACTVVVVVGATVVVVVATVVATVVVASCAPPWVLPAAAAMPMVVVSRATAAHTVTRPSLRYIGGFPWSLDGHESSTPATTSTPVHPQLRDTRRSTEVVNGSQCDDDVTN
ncbi:MAG: hypothetical protein WA814_12595 [Candidatus Baltobacteraceae bacterium]